MSVHQNQAQLGASFERQAKWLLVALVILFFGFLAPYLYITKILAIPIKYYLLGTLLPLALFFRPSAEVRTQFLYHPAVLWFAFYMVLTLTWFVAFPQSSSSVAAFNNNLTTTMVFCAVLIVSLVPGGLQLARKAMIGVVVFGCLVNIYQIVFPSVYHEYGWRSVGLYLNPNVSAKALVLGCLLTFEVVPKAFRGGYMALLLAGVLLTFSRSGTLALGVVLLGLLWRRLVTWRHLAIATAGCFTVGLSLLLYIRLGDFSGVQARFLGGAVVERLNLVVFDASGLDRVSLAQKGWEYMTQAPWFGHGLGSGVAWQTGQGPHNEYLQLMMDFGMWGVMLFPLLILAIAPRDKVGLTSAVTLLVIGFFDHNLLDSLDMPVCFAVLAASRVEVDRALEQRKMESV